MPRGGGTRWNCGPSGPPPSVTVSTTFVHQRSYPRPWDGLCLPDWTWSWVPSLEPLRVFIDSLATFSDFRVWSCTPYTSTVLLPQVKFHWRKCGCQTPSSPYKSMYSRFLDPLVISFTFTPVSVVSHTGDSRTGRKPPTVSQVVLFRTDREDVSLNS